MLLGLLVVWHSACGKFVVDIDMSNLEVTLTAHEYLAILLSDTSSKGIQLRKLWKKAARLIDEADMPEDSVIAQVSPCPLPLPMVRCSFVCLACSCVQQMLN